MNGPARAGGTCQRPSRPRSASASKDQCQPEWRSGVRVDGPVCDRDLGMELDPVPERIQYHYYIDTPRESDVRAVHAMVDRFHGRYYDMEWDIDARSAVHHTGHLKFFYGVRRCRRRWGDAHLTREIQVRARSNDDVVLVCGAVRCK